MVRRKREEKVRAKFLAGNFAPLTHSREESPESPRPLRTTTASHSSFPFPSQARMPLPEYVPPKMASVGTTVWCRRSRHSLQLPLRDLRGHQKSISAAAAIFKFRRSRVGGFLIDLLAEQAIKRLRSLVLVLVVVLALVPFPRQPFWSWRAPRCARNKCRRFRRQCRCCRQSSPSSSVELLRPLLEEEEGRVSGCWRLRRFHCLRNFLLSHEENEEDGGDGPPPAAPSPSFAAKTSNDPKSGRVVLPPT